MAEEKPHKPSEKRKREGRKQGTVLKSPLFSSTCSMVGTSLGLVFTTALFFINSEILLESRVNADLTGAVNAAIGAFRIVVLLVLVPLVTGSVFGLLAESFQVGLRFESEVLCLRLDRLNPATGLLRVFGGLRQVWFAVLKAVLVIACFTSFGCWFFSRFPQSFFLSPGHCLSLLGESSLGVVAGTAGLLSVLSAIEFVVKRKEYFRQLSMSDSEVRKENKEEEGDPYVRGRQRALREELLLGEIVKRVRRSTVIVVERQSASD
ncbi:MAG: EscU/YscU/HrcU family type III secretion system export apparatus switch protein [Bdellovibrionales bacterium]|nr:EscU/YscU/HrcU family type III secretion system export apparatus switch protein [Bdellovibrionales bacterium]